GHRHLALDRPSATRRRPTVHRERHRRYRSVPRGIGGVASSGGRFRAAASVLGRRAAQGFTTSYTGLLKIRRMVGIAKPIRYTPHEGRERAEEPGGRKRRLARNRLSPGGQYPLSLRVMARRGT